MRHLSITAIAACCFATMIGAQITHAEAANGGAPGDWLARYASTRSVGLGGAFVATPDEPLGALWNPAGLSLLYQNEGNVETARLFASRGANLVCLNRNPEKSERWEKELADRYGGRVRTIPVDFSSLERTKECARRLLELSEPMDVLIHNSGVYHSGQIIGNRPKGIHGNHRHDFGNKNRHNRDDQEP